MNSMFIELRSIQNIIINGHTSLETIGIFMGTKVQLMGGLGDESIV